MRVMEKQTKLIFNRQIALQLSRKGFPILSIVESYRKKNIDIYVFENSESFKRTFTNLVETRKSNKNYKSDWRKKSNVSTDHTITARNSTKQQSA